MLCPPSVIVALNTLQFPPELLPRMLLVTVAVPAWSKMAPPPPLGAELPEKVPLVTVSDEVAPVLEIAPPERPALLLEKVLLVTVSKRVAPVLEMAPPKAVALLLEKVL